MTDQDWTSKEKEGNKMNTKSLSQCSKELENFQESVTFMLSHCLKLN